MKEAILSSLTKAAKLDATKENTLNQRVIGEKEDVVTQGDLEIGDLITDTLLTKQERIIVESEEHGRQSNLAEGEEERYYVAIDDIDGTNNLRVGKGFLPYCSMVVAFDGKNKTENGYKYSDYSHAACLDYASGKIFYTQKGLGKVEVYDLDLNKIADSTENLQNNSKLALTLSTDVVSTQRGGLVGYASKDISPVSILPGILDTVYKKFAVVDSGCSVFEYAMVGMGIRNGYVSSGKKQHELPLLYAFSEETGKEMVDFNDIPYKDKVYDFKGGDAEVIAGQRSVIDEVLFLVKAQRQAIERVKEAIRNSAEKDHLGDKKIRNQRELEGQDSDNDAK